MPLRRSPKTWRSSPAARHSDFGQPLRALDVAGFRLRDAVYDPAQEIPLQPHPWASLCLAVEGGYVEDWGRIRVRCGPASLVFHPPLGFNDEATSLQDQAA